MHAAAKRQPSSRLIAHLRVRAITPAAVAAAVVLLALPAVAGASGTKQPGTRGVQPLWQGYPMNPGAGQIDRTAVPKRTTRAQSASAGGGGSSAAVPVVAAGGSMLLLAALATLVALQRRRAVAATPSTEGAHMSRFLNRRSNDELAGDAAAETVVPPAAEAAPAPDPEPVPAGAGNVGEHVQSVLKAAEDAAARMIEEAQTHAQEVRGEAEREASARLQTARAEADRLTEEVELARAEAATAAAEVRTAAEADAERCRAAADEEARQLRAQAERDAATFGEDAAARYDTLLEDTALAEDRLRRLVGGLRDVANRLDDLLEPNEDDQPVEPAEEAYADTDDRSLDEALDPGSPRAGATP